MVYLALEWSIRTSTRSEWTTCRPSASFTITSEAVIHSNHCPPVPTRNRSPSWISPLARGMMLAPPKLFAKILPLSSIARMPCGRISSPSVCTHVSSQSQALRPSSTERATSTHLRRQRSLPNLRQRSDTNFFPSPLRWGPDRTYLCGCLGF